MTRGRRPTTPQAAAGLAGAILAYLAYRWRVAPRSLDLAVYRATGAAVRHGLSPYGDLHLADRLRATYPPLAALAFVPLSALSLTVLADVVLVLNIALLVVVCRVMSRLVTIPPARQWPTALIVAAIGLAAEPVVATLNLGQIDLALLLLVLVDLARPDGARLRGVAIGLAAAIKLTPGLFIVYLLVTRRYRESLVATATFLVAGALAWLLLPGASHDYWTRLVFRTSRVGLTERPDNQSLRGLIARIMGQADPGTLGTIVAAGATVAGLAIAAFAHRRLGEAWGATACGFTALLAAPISWTHHWVWCVPAAVLLWSEARRWTVVLVVFWTYVVDVPMNRYHQVTLYGPGTTALSGAYAYAAIAFLALTLSRAVRVTRSPGGRSR